MSTVDARPDTKAPDWHEDTIYCEATCEPKDVYCEGSDDEDYDDPLTRKKRYEAAGRRYLDGNAPMLLSAALRGPFHKESGWVNPWRSKNRTSKTLQPVLASRSLAVHQRNRSRISPGAEGDQPAETQDSLECHLPSPESLKQAPFTESHPFLEEDELVHVQNWRNNISPPAVGKDDFWAASPLAKSSKRRRTNESSWLKRIANKRQKTELTDEDSANTPILRRSRTTGLDAPSSNISNEQPSLSESFNSAPEYLISSTQKSAQKRKPDGLRDGDREMDSDDELVSGPGASFNSAPARLISPTKRISPRRRPNKVAGHQTKYSDDELGQHRMAAATLSSPVSQKGYLQVPSQSQASGVQTNLSQRIMPTILSQQGETLGSSSPLSEAQSSISSLSDVPMTDLEGGSSSEEESRILETQEDQSFCFKIMKTRKGTASVNSAPMSQTNDDLSDTDSSLTSLADTEEIETSEDDASQLSVEEAPMDEPGAADVASNGDDTALIPPTQTSEVIPVSIKTVDSKCKGSFQGNLNENLVSTTQATVQDVEEADQQDVVNTEPVEACAQLDSDSNEAAQTEEANYHNSPGASQHSIGIIEVGNSSDSKSTSSGPSIPSDEVVVARSSNILACATPPDIRQPTRRGSTTGNLEDSPLQTPSASQERRFSQFSLKSILNRYVSPLRLLSGLGIHSSQSSQQDVATQRTADTHAADTSFHSQGAMDLDQEELQCGSDETSTCTDTASLADTNESNERATPSHDPSTSHESGSTTTEPVPPIAAAVLDKSVTQETPEKTPPAFSQQGPWVKSQMPSQENVMDQVLAKKHGQCNTPAKVGELTAAIPVNAQSPWARDSENILMSQNQALPLFNTVDKIPSLWGSQGNAVLPSPGEAPDNTSQASTQSRSARSSTPEPQFAFASFASFMTPSPERRARRNNRLSLRASSTQGILASAMKNPWRSSTPRRVSWAPLPHERQNMSESPKFDTTPSLKRDRERPASPPPMTPLSELPTSEDSRFRGHFTAMANRTDGVRQRLLPSASQQILRSPEPLAMAEKFLAADHIGKSSPTNSMLVDEQAEASPTEPDAEDTQDPMDIVEDIFNEMGDFLQTWDVDAELDEARKAPQLRSGATSQIGGESQQSPW